MKKLNATVTRGFMWAENGEFLYAHKGNADFRGVKADGMPVSKADEKTVSRFKDMGKDNDSIIVSKSVVKAKKDARQEFVQVKNGLLSLTDLSRALTLFRVESLRFYVVKHGIIADVDGKRAVFVKFIREYKTEHTEKLDAKAAKKAAEKPEHKTVKAAKKQTAKPETKAEHTEKQEHKTEHTEKQEPEKQADPLSPEWFADCRGSKAVREKYIELARRFHPDNKGGNADIFANIAKAYEVALLKGKAYDLEHKNDVKGFIPKKTALTDDEKAAVFDREFKAAAAVIAKLPAHCSAELCGIYIWIHGTKREDVAARKLMKENGFYYASKKVCWYWKPSYYKSSGRGCGKDMGYIRGKYGSRLMKAVNDDE